MALNSVVSSFFELRLQEAVIRFCGEYYEKKELSIVKRLVRLFVTLNALVGTLGFVCCLLVALFFAGYFVPEGTEFGILLLGALVYLVGICTAGVSIGLFRVFDDFKTYAILRVIGSAINIIGLISVVVFFEGSPVSVLWQTAVTFTLGNLIIFVGSLRLSRKILEGVVMESSLAKNLLRDIRTFVLSTWGSQMASMPTKEIDVLLLAHYSTLREVACYKIARQFLGALWMITDPLMTVVYPEFVRLRYSGSMNAVKNLARKLSIYLGLVGAIIYIISILVVPYIVQYFLGPDYITVSSLYAILAFSVVVWMPLLWANPLILSCGGAKVIFFITLCVGAVTILSYFIAGYLFGVYGIATVSMLNICLISFLSFWYVIKKKFFIEFSVLGKAH